MWNGFWKLTVMVGVIGVGLFAAWQAQKGMTRGSSTVSSDSADVNDVAAPDERALVVDSKRRSRRLDDADEFGSAKSGTKPRRLPADSDDDQIELVSNTSTGKSGVKTANGASAKLAVLDRTSPGKGLSFDDDESFDSGTTKESGNNDIGYADARHTDTGAPKPLPDEDFDEANSPGNKFRSNRKVKVTAAVESDSGPESTVDPFSDESSVSDEKPSIIIQAPANVEPGRARINTDFDDAADVPRSRRALVGSGRRLEKPVESDVDPFADDRSRQKAGLQTDSGSSIATGDPVLGLPEPLHNSSTPDLPPSQNKPESTPRNLPSETDETPTYENVPSRLGTTLRRPLAIDEPDRELLETPPLSLRDSQEPQTRRNFSDLVTPVDLVGDGEVGIPSQRGVQQPRLTIEKVAQQQAILDQPLVYSIIVKNLGTVDAHNVVIEDRIPKGSELVGTSPRAELAGKRLVWNEPLLKPNEEKKISIKVIPKQEGPIGSVARVYFTTEVSAEIQVAAPQLEFRVNAPREVRIGQKFDLTFNLKNVGKVDAGNISVRDIVPEHLKHEAGLDIECPIGKLAPNEAREIVLNVTAVKTGSVVNRAVLTADSGIRKEQVSSIDIVGESLVLTRTGQNRLYLERPAVFTNSIRNDGNMAASRVRISEVVPAGMEFDTASDGGKYDSNLRAVVWTVGPLEPGADKAVTVKYVPKSTGTLEGKITATGSMGSSAAVNSTVDVVGKPELQMETLSATGTVTVGDQITSKFQLKNSGTAPAQNVQLKIRLPKELRLVKVRGARFQQNDDTILFDSIVELLPRAVAAFELVLEPIEEADARIGLEISANHLTKSHRREETIQIARDPLR